MNKAMLIGNLTKDVDFRTTQGGTPVASFTIAVQRRFKNQNGEYDADFLPVVVWKGQAEACAQHLYKGSQVAVAGAIQTRQYDDKNGVRRYITEIVADEVQFLSMASGSAQSDGGNVAMQELDDSAELPF